MHPITPSRSKCAFLHLVARAKIPVMFSSPIRFAASLLRACQSADTSIAEGDTPRTRNHGNTLQYQRKRGKAPARFPAVPCQPVGFTASLLAPLLLASCGFNGTDPDEGETPAVEANAADAMASHDPRPGEPAVVEIRDSEERPMMRLQVVLDRQGFGPGVIDGREGMSTANALKGFQEANGLDVTGEYDEATGQALARWDNIPATRVVRIPQDWAEIAYREVPEEPEDQAKMDHLGYESIDEKLAERFHTTVEVLRELNPGGRPAGMTGGAVTAGTDDLAAGGRPTAEGNVRAAERDAALPEDEELQPIFRPGQLVRVPNIGADRIFASEVDDEDWVRTLASLGVGSEQPSVTRVVVDKSEGWLQGYNEAGDLVAMVTETSGSSHDPLPLGEWGINGVAHNPPFAFDPDLFWDVSDSEEEQHIPPGPNGPVGVVWIDITKEHYGIHGTPEPQTIGRTQSHGCVRLTNWDVARLAGMVGGSTKVLFQA